MQYKCETCHDTADKDKSGGYLNCPDCDAPHQRASLNKWLMKQPALSPFDQAWAIHQRALAIGLADAVEGVLTEMQPGGALHMPQEPVAHLKYWAAQRWSGCGDHEIEHGEGLEVCEPGEIGADGLPAFPVFMHAIPGALAMAPKQEAPDGWVLVPVKPTPKMVDSTFNHDISELSHNSRNKHIWAAMIVAATEPIAAPAAANGALTDDQIDAAWDSLPGANIIQGQNSMNWNSLIRRAFARAILRQGEKK